MWILVTFNTASALHVQAEVAYRSFSCNDSYKTNNIKMFCLLGEGKH